MEQETTAYRIPVKMHAKRVELCDVTLVLPRWEAVHANGGGQRGAELRNDYYGRGPPSRRLPTGWGRRSGSSTMKRARRNVVRNESPASRIQTRAVRTRARRRYN